MAEEVDGGQERMRKRRIARFAGCTILVVALGFAMAWGGRSIEARQAPQAKSGAATGPRLQPAVREDPQASATIAARAIDAGNLETVAPGRASGWVRDAPRAPLGPSALAAVPPRQPAPVAPPEPDPGTPRPTLLFGAIATAAGRIEAVGHVIELEGVQVVDPTRQCTGQGGRSWPCGAVARAAFRAWLRGRAVECTVTPLPLPRPVVSLCRSGGKDMAAWLVANGLAEASSGSAYEQAGQEARAAHRGMFGDRPRALPQPAPVPPSAFAEDAPQPAAPFAEVTGRAPIQPDGVGGVGRAAAPTPPP